VTSLIWKQSKILLILVLAVSLALLLTLAMPATRVQAQSLTLTTTVLPGVTHVKLTGEGFVNYRNQYVYIYFQNNFIKATQVSQAGTFTTEFYIPGEGISDYIIVKDRNEREITRALLFPPGAPRLKLDLTEAEVGDWVEVDGTSFGSNQVVQLHFSSDNVDRGSLLDGEVTAYKNIGSTRTLDNGKFDTSVRFQVPDKLTDGSDKKDVRGDVYYIYATYFLGNKRIAAVSKLVVIDGQIAPNPTKSNTGSEVAVSGRGFRTQQKITIQYDGNTVNITGGASESNSDGRFNCTIIIPESTGGNHTITVISESGDKFEAPFNVEPRITVTPLSATAGRAVTVNGTGFGRDTPVTFVLDGNTVPTAPGRIQTDDNGSFSGSFVIPDQPSYVIGGTSTISVKDNSFNSAETTLNIRTTLVEISLSPSTSRTSPGHVGMKITTRGTGFIPDKRITLSYGNGETITVANTNTDTDGKFSTSFIVPPGHAGAHTVTATDGANRVTSTFTMESEAPAAPAPVSPSVATTPEKRAYFDWTDVKDISGVTYTFQIAADTNFADIVLEKNGLTKSEYTIDRQSELELTNKQTRYYWRVKAIDGASNESGWTSNGSFYPTLSWSTPWPTMTILVIATPIVIGIVGIFLIVLGYRRSRKSSPDQGAQ